MLEVQNISHAYGTKPVLQDINLTLPSGEILCLLGPSGCGKTTLLRIVAGLEKFHQGDVLFDGQSIKNVPVHQRDFGLMFQDFALFPHKNVAQNIAFGLKMRGMNPKEQAKRVEEILSLVGLNGYEKRDVSQLSGGEKQRVALARSLAPQPRLLLLDEPLGSLDAALREKLVIELRDIIKSVGLTAIYVTHDRQEAFAIADRIAIMNAGYFEQVDTPENIYWQPKTIFVARFMGLNNIVPVLRSTPDNIETSLGRYAISKNPEFVLIHPDGIEIHETGDIQGIIESCIFQGGHYQLRVKINEIALIFQAKSAYPKFIIGQPIQLKIASDKIVTLFPSR